MKTIALFSLLISYVAGAAVKEVEEMKKDEMLEFECVTDGFFPFPKDCTKFILCADKTAVAYSCDPDLHFSESSGMCDWPQVANCEWADESELEVVKVEKPKAQQCIRPAQDEYTCVKNGAYPHAKLCDFYYDCWDGNATLCRCRDGYLFDLTYAGCNYPEQVECGKRVSPDSTMTQASVTKSAENTGDFSCPEISGLFPNLEECSSFYNCVGGVPRKENCYPGLVFNPSQKSCDYPSNVPECPIVSRQH